MHGDFCPHDIALCLVYAWETINWCVHTGWAYAYNLIRSWK